MTMFIKIDFLSDKMIVKIKTHKKLIKKIKKKSY